MRLRTGPLLLAVALTLAFALIAGRAAAGLYTDALWYGETGYGSVFRTRLITSVVVQLMAAVAAGGWVLANLWVVARQVGTVHVRRRYGNLEIAERIPRRLILAGILLTSLLAGWWLASLQFGGGEGMSVYAWLRRAHWGLADPIFGRDASFFVFTLPLYLRLLEFGLLVLIWSLILVAAGYVLVGSAQIAENRVRLDPGARLHLVVLAAGLLLLIAAQFWLSRYSLLLDGDGIGGALGYTDVRARLPARAGLALIALVSAVSLVYGAWRRAWMAPVIAIGVLLVTVVVAGYVVPTLVQRFEVEPNELAREAPFIRWNLDFTRTGFGLDELTRHRFAYRPAAPRPWAEVAPELAFLPLWDARLLRSTLNQRQSLFRYYSFEDIDFDRYGPPGARRQVAITVREFDPEGLEEGARTWQNLRLNPRYIRGMGAVATPADQVTPDGEPLLWLYGIDPVQRSGLAPVELELSQPAVYFGENTRGYAIVIPGRDGAIVGEAGHDYPRGIRLGSLTRVLAFVWRFGDMNLLFSGEVDQSSRVLFRRAVTERLRALAPFLVWDGDPYPVIHDGRVHWVVDGYSASSSFPLARPYGRGEVRYLRNSVKGVVDAVTGEVRLYRTGPAEPMVETYARVHPELMRPREEMPAWLERHLRYPALLFDAQAQVLQEYHLDRTEAFYAGEDVWQIPRGAGREMAGEPYAPQYMLLRLPGTEAPEFLLTIPYIARQRQNMTALLAARNDPPHYGEVVLFELPRDQLIPGPGQVQALIEQDPTISAQLSLWRQAGSTVSLGQIMVVPLDSSFIYVQPLFLSLTDRQQEIPNLERVIVSDGRSVSMAARLPEAVEGLRRWTEAERDGRDGPDARDGPDGPEEEEPPAGTGDWPREALEIMRRADERLRAGDWAGFGDRWAELEALLDRLARERP